MLDMNVITTQAKWDNVVLDGVGNRAKPGSDNRPVVQAIRSANSNMRLVYYSLGSTLFKCATGWWWDAGCGWSWCLNAGLDCDATGRTCLGTSSQHGLDAVGCDTSGADYSWSRMKAIRATNAILYSSTRDRNNDGHKDAACAGADVSGHCGANIQIDWAMPGIAQALADTIAAWAQELPGVWNGIFVDEICSSTLFNFNGAGEDSVDFAHSGSANLAAWDVAYQAGVAAFWTRLRTQVPADWIIVGNCGAMSADTTINGWMRENFPLQNGGTWETNMFGPAPGVALDVGYIGNDNTYAAPILTMLTRPRSTTVTDTTTAQSNVTVQQRHRFVLASATLGEGAGTMVGTRFDLFRGYLPWWADEFSVTPTGFSSLSTTYKGWLGDPISEHYATSGGGWRRDFKGGSVILNPKTSGTVDFFMGSTFYRISGLVCPSVNNGASASSVTLGPQDALFLQRRPALH
jgi:hypothetical protein